jgi:hypothetical protein
LLPANVLRKSLLAVAAQPLAISVNAMNHESFASVFMVS